MESRLCSRRRLSMLAATVGALIVTAGPAQAQAQTRAAQTRAARPVAHVSSVATVVAGKLVEGGSNYLIAQMNAGLLGDQGKEVGNFLTQVGVYDDSKEQVAAIREQLNAIDSRLTTLQNDVRVQNDKIDALGGAVASGNYSILVGQANELRSSILSGQRLLIDIANAPREHRARLVADFIDLYRNRLAHRSIQFEGYMVGGGAGADGIMQLASKKARGAAQPFFTYQMSEFPREVWSDYSMVRAVWLELELNYLSYSGASHQEKAAAVANASNSTSAMWRVLPPNGMYPATVIDTRTGVMWTWTVDGTRCYTDPTLRGALAVNQCYYSLAGSASRATYDTNWQNSPFSTTPTNGSPPDGWRRATVDQLKELDRGASGTPAQWLNSRAGFPADLTGEVWTSGTLGSNATTINQSTGATSTRPRSDRHFTLLVGNSGIPWYQYWF